MTHELDPLTPMNGLDGEPLSDAERYVFFEGVAAALKHRYRSDRANKFATELPVGEQLDLLWHELSQNGSISQDGPWFKAVKAIKEFHLKDQATYAQAVADVAAMRKKQPSPQPYVPPAPPALEGV